MSSKNIVELAILSIATAIHVREEFPPANFWNNLTYDVTCENVFGDLANDTKALLDDPELVCALHKSNISSLTRGSSSINLIPTHMTQFRDHNAHAKEIFVIGPESSGTTFVKHVLKLSFKSPDILGAENDWEDITNCPTKPEEKTVLHFSEPCFGHCGISGSDVAFLDNFGCLASNAIRPKRSILNISSAIIAHRDQGQPINIVQVVRDPRPTLLSKLLKHCSYREIAAAEQRIAYDLMLEAKNMPEVKTVCYEHMVHSNGAAYLAKTLEQFNVIEGNVPAITNANVPYNMDPPSVCGHDERAYMELCPETPIGVALKDIC